MTLPSSSPGEVKQCAHGHTSRKVGCVSCVLVFDRPAEKMAGEASETPEHELTVADVNAINALLAKVVMDADRPERQRIADLMWKLVFLGQRIERATLRAQSAPPQMNRTDKENARKRELTLALRTRPLTQAELVEVGEFGAHLFVFMYTNEDGSGGSTESFFQQEIDAKYHSLLLLQDLIRRSSEPLPLPPVQEPTP